MEPSNSPTRFSFESSGLPWISYSTNFVTKCDSTLSHQTVSQCLSQVLDGDFNQGQLEPEVTSKIPLEHLQSMCRNKQGSKETQIFISRCTPQQIQSVVEILLPSISCLMIDTYGNYTCQKLFQNCSSFQRVQLLSAMRSSLKQIAKHKKGTHSLQALISFANLQEEVKIYQEQLSGYILQLCYDFHASHVIQKLILILNIPFFIIREILGHVKQLATDKLGLAVIKKCVRHPQVYEELLRDTLVLIQDPYGNYAMQLVIQTWKAQCAEKIIEAVRGKVIQLSIQKYASNVIEKCLKEKSIQESILEEFVREGSVQMLVNCPFGCYVLRTASEEAKGIYRKMLKTELAKLSPGRFNSKIENIIINLSKQ